jgi:hypothetical protein
MTPRQTTDPEQPRTEPFRWPRSHAASAFDHANDPQRASQRQYARQHGIPRATLGDWLRHQPPPGLDPQLGDFLRSSAGERFQRRLVLALFLVFHLQGACGLRLLGQFLAMCGLDAFVASSYGALHTFGATLDELLADFARDERGRLAEDMLERLVALIVDENFHGASPCLVAIEPVADFIVVEEYQPQRDALTWTAAIRRGLAGLPLKVVLLTGDEARGLICCAEKHLQVQYLPELFHGQRDLGQPLFGPLRRQTEAARKSLERSREVTQHWRDEKERASQGPPRPGRPLDLDGRIELAGGMEQGAARSLEACVQREQQAQQALRGLADDYHPFDARTGQPLTAEQVQQRLQQRLSVLEQITQAAQLGGKAAAALAGGAKWLVTLVASVAWFWTLAHKRIQELGLPEEAEKQVLEQLLPGLYWERAARQGRTPEERQAKQALAERLQKEAWAAGGALSQLGKEARQEVERVAREVVGLFQRSSSCVEGRNGRLSLFQHGHTRLTPRKLTALTAVHNYVVRRSDGTTAAERLFGKKQRDVLAWLLERLPDLPRPAAKRPKKGRQQVQAAA